MFSLQFDFILIVVECSSAESEGDMFYSWGGLKIFPFFFHAREKTVTLLSFPFSYTNLSFLFKKQYCAKILRNKIHELFFHVILAASFPNIVDP